jgi:thiamine kinase-like enzyme
LILISKGIVSVDWEFSGWGDPCFDLAGLLAHPAYVDQNLSKIKWAADYYNGLGKQKDFNQKFDDYLLTLFIYWAARYLNLLNNTDQTKPFNWRDRPSLRQENYESI